ncbi:hypothetical protein FEM48_Zijuj01G0092900 [Ziziphus jujuba var. spinosa]|uniref:Uncharacterized protein n=1 Tax=Ziziphus jujuba var. spinosa TaxID=714518 RepID=A0A978W0E5_ZIZJJ|nr:hypothetical protein FEM48_Zijuj01G0092900 [Ziziphus jujuba var. spinosa]
MKLLTYHERNFRSASSCLLGMLSATPPIPPVSSPTLCAINHWKYKAIDTKLEHGNYTDCIFGPSNEDPISHSPLFGIDKLANISYGGILYLRTQVQRKRRSETVALFPYVSSLMCGSMAQSHIMLSFL